MKYKMEAVYSTLYTMHFTLYTLHSTLYTLHTTHYALCSTFYILFCLFYTLYFALATWEAAEDIGGTSSEGLVYDQAYDQAADPVWEVALTLGALRSMLCALHVVLRTI